MATDMPSPISADGEKHDEGELPALDSADLGSPSMGYDFSNVRVRIPLTTSDLNLMLTHGLADTFILLSLLAPWQQIPRNPALRKPGL
jgi:hypothetical protein